MQETRKISELKNWQDNPREASKADMDNLRWGLKKYGMLTPLLILDDGTVIGGNHRLDVLREMGVKDAWVNVVHPKNKAEMIEIAMLDNQQTANWINDKLAELVNKYKDDIDIERIKIETKSQTLDEILREFSPDEIVEDEVPEVSDEPAISKLGEVYQLGRHRVMCGDSTKIEDVEKLMDGKKADMVFTDPPYGMDLDTDYSKLPSTKKEGNKTYSKVIGDNQQFNFQDYLWIECPEQIWFGANYYAKTLPDGGSWIVWDKRVEEKFDKMFGSGFEIAWSKTPHKQKIYRHNNTLFGGDSEARGKEHPTQKPTKLCVEIIKDIGKDNDLVLDLFLGSGSTLIACEQTNRTCYGMELDEKYLDVVRKRWAKYVYPDRWEDEWQTLTPSSHL